MYEVNIATWINGKLGYFYLIFVILKWFLKILNTYNKNNIFQLVFIYFRKFSNFRSWLLIINTQ